MSGELRIKITGLKEVEHHFEAAIRQFEDMRAVMRRIRDQLYRDYMVIWDKGQKSWADWSPAYARWRLGDGRMERYAESRGLGLSVMPFGEMMDLTGRLRESLTSDDPENIAILNRKSITFGTAVWYAGYVTEGGRVGGKYGPPKKSSFDGVSSPYREARPLTGKFTDAMERKWRRIVENYAMDALS